MKALQILIFCFCFTAVKAQRLQKKIINTAGTVYNSNGTILRVSIGEPVVGNLMVNNSTVLSQGFFTGFSANRGVSPPTPDSAAPVPVTTISIYPNPIKDNLFIKGDLFQAKQGLIFDVAGHFLFARPVNAGILQMNNLPSGFYILKLMNTSNEVMKVFKIVKL